MNVSGLVSMSLALLRAPRLTSAVLRQIAGDGTGVVPSTDTAIRYAADWLLEAQRNCPDGRGYSRRFRPAFGWDKGYTETTGYIIPTLLVAAGRLGEPRYRDSAVAAGEWLLARQNANGSFSEIDRGTPQAFDTGQVLLGLLALAREVPENPAYAMACDRAAQWLLETLNADGTWTSVAYAGEAHTYYSRSGAAMLHAAFFLKKEEYAQGARRHLEWVLSRQRPSGWFDRCEFEVGRPALLHTIVYVMEGLLDAHACVDDLRYLEAAQRSAAGLLKAVEGEAGKLPAAYYTADWKPVSTELCITGLAQWAGVCRRLARLLGDRSFDIQADSALRKLRQLQILAPGPLHGALPNVIPWTGSYGKMGAFNWNAKFYIDALFQY